MFHVYVGSEVKLQIDVREKEKEPGDAVSGLAILQYIAPISVYK